MVVEIGTRRTETEIRTEIERGIDVLEREKERGKTIVRAERGKIAVQAERGKIAVRVERGTGEEGAEAGEH